MTLVLKEVAPDQVKILILMLVHFVKFYHGIVKMTALYVFVELSVV